MNKLYSHGDQSKRKKERGGFDFIRIYDGVIVIESMYVHAHKHCKYG